MFTSLYDDTVYHFWGASQNMMVYHGKSIEMKDEWGTRMLGNLQGFSGIIHGTFVFQMRLWGLNKQKWGFNEQKWWYNGI